MYVFYPLLDTQSDESDLEDSSDSDSDGPSDTNFTPTKETLTVDNVDTLVKAAVNHSTCGMSG